MAKLSIDQLDLRGKRVLMRVDFNVPQDKDGNITNPQRIVAALPTIKLRPRSRRLGGADEPPRPARRRTQAASTASSRSPTKLQELLGRPVKFLTIASAPRSKRPAPRSSRATSCCSRTCASTSRKKARSRTTRPAKPSRRRRPSKLEAFRKSLSKLGDVYVNDAFGTAHRAAQLDGRRQAAAAGRRLPDEEGARRLRQGARPSASGRCWRSSAAPRSPTRSSSSRTSSTRPTRSSSAAAWRTPSSRCSTTWRSARRCSIARAPRSCPKVMAKAKAKGVKIHLPVDFKIADKFDFKAKQLPQAPRRDRHGQRRHPAGLAGARLRAGVDQAVSRSRRPGQDDRVERPARRLRVRPSSRPAPGR